MSDTTPRGAGTTAERRAASGVRSDVLIDNGASRTKPKRPRGKRKEEPDEFAIQTEAPPPVVEPGLSAVQVERLERWEFPRGKKHERQPKITFWCTIVGGKENGTRLPLRMNFEWPLRRFSNLGETVCLAVGGKQFYPTRASRISLRRLFVGRVFIAQIKTLVTPYRDENWKPLKDQDGNEIERVRSSVIERFVSAETGPPNPHDYLL